MTGTAYDTLLKLLVELYAHRVGYTLASDRAEAIMVQLAVPGERWEIEVMSDGSVEVERFHRDGSSPSTPPNQIALPSLFLPHRRDRGPVPACAAAVNWWEAPAGWPGDGSRTTYRGASVPLPWLIRRSGWPGQEAPPGESSTISSTKRGRVN